MVGQKRYQLTKDAVIVVNAGHPWLFRTHLSSAAEIFKDGDWLRLVDSKNEPVGYGIFEKEGLIGIRVLKKGKTAPDIAWFKKHLSVALKKREHLRKYTGAFRAVHGENDGFPGIVIDVYGETAVLQTYSNAVDSLGRYLAQVLRGELHLKNVIWKPPVKRKNKGEQKPVRCLHGRMPGITRFKEGKLDLAVDIGAGQKSGAFLDLRGLRKWVAAEKLTKKRVLNLFSYSGTLGLAAEVAGATEIWNVDISEGALEASRKFHVLNEKHFRFVSADIFKWVDSLAPSEKFDVIIVDPPQMASQKIQVPNALRAYRELYKSVYPHLAPGGKVIVCCCTSRIPRQKFRAEADKVFSSKLKLLKSLGPEDDHPIGFSEGDYLKILIYGGFKSD